MKTVFVTIGNQKGGAGKTTTTMLLASLLHARCNLKIAVMDIDPQKTFSEFRDREMVLINKSIEEKKWSDLSRAYANLTKDGKGVFDVFAKVLPNEEVDLMLVLSEIANLKKLEKYVIIFYFPGYLAESKFIRLLVTMDVVLVPFYPDSFSWQSTYMYLRTLKKFIDKGLGIKKLAIFGFRYSKARRTREFDVYMDDLKKANINVLQGKVYDSTGIEDFRSTIIDYDLQEEKSLMGLCDELVELVNEVRN